MHRIPRKACSVWAATSWTSPTQLGSSRHMYLVPSLAEWTVPSRQLLAVRCATPHTDASPRRNHLTTHLCCCLETQRHSEQSFSFTHVAHGTHFGGCHGISTQRIPSLLELPISMPKEKQ